MTHVFSVFFIYLPELAILTYLTLLLADAPLHVRRILLAALLYSPVLAALRAWFPWGLHTVLSITAYPFLLSSLFAVRYRRMMYAFLASLSVLFFFEVIVTCILARTDITGHNLSRLALTIPVTLALAVVAAILHKTSLHKRIQM